MAAAGIVEEGSGETLLPARQDRLQSAAVEMWTQPLFKQIDDSEPGDGRADHQIHRRAGLHHKRSDGVDPHQFSLALKLPGRRRAALEPPAEARMGEQVARVLGPSSLIEIAGRNVTSAQVAEARSIAEIVCVQNLYNVVHREDDALIDELKGMGVAYVPFFPLGGFTPLQSTTLSDVARDLGATPMQTALAWLLHRSPNILLIPGTSSLGHLRENLGAARLKLSDDALARLDAIGEKNP